MKKLYSKPEAEVISFYTEEITAEGTSDGSFETTADHNFEL